MHGTPSSRSFPKDGGVSCFVVFRNVDLLREILAKEECYLVHYNLQQIWK